MHTFARTMLGAALVATLSAAPALAASDHREFEGTVVHVSDSNLKVHGIEGGKAQTIGFEGNFKNRKLHPGEYVKVIFDQKLLGLRHADMVEPYGDPAMAKKH